MKKWFSMVALLVALLCLTLLTACSGGQTETPPEADPNVLTEAELAEFQDLFSSGSWYSQGTWRYFDSPEYVSLRHLFYDGIGYQGLPRGRCYVTQAEEDWFYSQKDPDGLSEHLEIFRAPREAMEYILQECYGITLEESQKVGLDTFVYWEETDAYYHNHSDTAVTSVTLQSGYRTEDGCVQLVYCRGSKPLPNEELGLLTLKLVDDFHYDSDRYDEDHYIMIANQPYEPEE